MISIVSILSHAKPATAMAVLLPATFVVGIFALIALLVVALVAVIWVASLCFEVVGELSTQITTRSTQADPVVYLFMLVLFAYAVVKRLHLGRR